MTSEKSTFLRHSLPTLGSLALLRLDAGQVGAALAELEAARTRLTGSLMPRKKASRPMPAGVTGPMPVILTRRRMGGKRREAGRDVADEERRPQ